jgi:3-deoxy-D-manno-octulosonic-acid transferase
LPLLEVSFGVKTAPLQRDTKNLNDAKVLIIDTVGLLTRCIAMQIIAYVGGAMGTTECVIF